MNRTKRIAHNSGLIILASIALPAHAWNFNALLHDFKQSPKAQLMVLAATATGIGLVAWICLGEKKEKPSKELINPSVQTPPTSNNTPIVKAEEPHSINGDNLQYLKHRAQEVTERNETLATTPRTNSAKRWKLPNNAKLENSQKEFERRKLKKIHITPDSVPALSAAAPLPAVLHQPHSIEQDQKGNAENIRLLTQADPEISRIKRELESIKKKVGTAETEKDLTELEDNLRAIRNSFAPFRGPTQPIDALNRRNLLERAYRSDFARNGILNDHFTDPKMAIVQQLKALKILGENEQYHEISSEILKERIEKIGKNFKDKETPTSTLLRELIAIVGNPSARSVYDAWAKEDSILCITKTIELEIMSIQEQIQEKIDIIQRKNKNIAKHEPSVWQAYIVPTALYTWWYNK